MEKNTYPVESWKVTEKKFLKEWNYRNETTFALSNDFKGAKLTKNGLVVKLPAKSIVTLEIK